MPDGAHTAMREQKGLQRRHSLQRSHPETSARPLLCLRLRRPAQRRRLSTKSDRIPIGSTWPQRCLTECGSLLDNTGLGRPYTSPSGHRLYSCIGGCREIAVTRWLCSLTHRPAGEARTPKSQLLWFRLPSSKLRRSERTFNRHYRIPS